MKDLPKDLAARVSRQPVPVADQLTALAADLEATKAEEREVESQYGNPKRIIRSNPNRRALPPLKAVPAKRPRDFPSRPVLATNPTVVNPDADDQRFKPGLGRNPYLINFTNEWLVVTAHTLAMRCSRQANGSFLNEDQLLALAESIRKSNLEKMYRGKTPAMVKVDSPSRPAGRLTTFGASFVNYKFPTDNENDSQRLSKSIDVPEALALATVAARLSVPSPPGSWGKGNEGLEPALPVIGGYRIAASLGRRFSSNKEAQEARWKSLKKWAQIPEGRGGLPAADPNWNLSLMDDKMFAKVHNALLTPIPGKRSVDGVGGEDIVWPASLFETYDENGNPDGLIDGVIGAPWSPVLDQGTNEVIGYRPGFSAIVSELHGQTSERTEYVLSQIFETGMFSSLYVFVTGNTHAVTFERVWEKLRKGRLKGAPAEWLHIAFYEPLNSGREEYRDEVPPALSRGEKKNPGAG